MAWTADLTALTAEVSRRETPGAANDFYDQQLSKEMELAIWAHVGEILLQRASAEWHAAIKAVWPPQTEKGDNCGDT